MNQPLHGRVALVTGGARGIGAATALRLAAGGAAVVVTDVDGVPLHETVAAIRASGADAHAVCGDLTLPDFPDNLVANVLARYGDLHIIVNAAGYLWPQAIHRMSDEQFLALQDIHVTAPFRLLRSAGLHFREAVVRERAVGATVMRKVVNVSALGAVSGLPMSVNYCSAKAAVIGMTLALAKEWGPLHVNVNCVAFGLIQTRLTDPRVAEHPVLDIAGREVNIGKIGLQVSEIARTIPLGRPGTVEEAAGAIYLLCLPESDYITGDVLLASGGLR
ncbi:MAG: SDR family oxidoreductase [Sinimarinibacterium sp.]|jgi:3-oxoacyl-[acyl-carrier protein] reductase